MGKTGQLCELCLFGIECLNVLATKNIVERVADLMYFVFAFIVHTEPRTRP